MDDTGWNIGRTQRCSENSALAIMTEFLACFAPLSFLLPMMQLRVNMDSASDAYGRYAHEIIILTYLH